MNKFIIKTSNLGYDVSVYEVETDLPTSRFLEIDSKYGMQYRHQSTHIEQLELGAKTEGFVFSYVTLIKDGKHSEGDLYKEDYYARSGNY